MKQLVGSVSSISGNKTARVTVSRQWRHPLYLKSVKRTKKYACHFEDIDLKIGDEVVIVSCKPMSRHKHFKILQKVEAKS